MKAIWSLGFAVSLLLAVGVLALSGCTQPAGTPAPGAAGSSHAANGGGGGGGGGGSGGGGGGGY